MILLGGVTLGVWVALSMKKRVVELRQIERIINDIEGEIRYHNSLLREAIMSAAMRSGQPFRNWLSELSKELDNNYNDAFMDIWERSLVTLKENSHLKKEDIKEILLFGQALGYLDVKAMELSLGLEKENIHSLIKNLNQNLANNMKVSVILGTLGGIFLILVLV